MDTLQHDLTQCLTVLNAICYNPTQIPDTLTTPLKNPLWNQRIRTSYEEYFSSSTKTQLLYSPYQIMHIQQAIEQGQWLELKCFHYTPRDKAFFMPFLIQRLPRMSLDEQNTFITLYLQSIGLDDYAIHWIEQYQLRHTHSTLTNTLYESNGSLNGHTIDRFLHLHKQYPTFMNSLIEETSGQEIFVFMSHHFMYQSHFKTIFHSFSSEQKKIFINAINNQKLSGEALYNKKAFLTYYINMLTLLHQENISINAVETPFLATLHRALCHHPGGVMVIQQKSLPPLTIHVDSNIQIMVLNYQIAYGHQAITTSLLLELWDNKHNTMWDELSTTTKELIIQQIQRWDLPQKQALMTELLKKAYIDQRRYEHFPLLQYLGFTYGHRKLVSSVRETIYQQYGISKNPQDIQRECENINDTLYDGKKSTRSIMDEYVSLQMKLKTPETSFLEMEHLML